MTETMTTAAGTPATLYDDADALGETLAREILEGIAAAPLGQRYLLGCPGGRSLRSTYQAMARLVPPDADLGNLVIVMMDEYVEGEPGARKTIDPALPWSCQGFAQREIVAPLNAAVTRGRGIRAEHLWGPDPADPEAYDRRIADAGGVELFLAASGAGDGHVAFVAPPGELGGGACVVDLAEQTRRDNMGTFPQFESLDDVPRLGVTLGLGSIAGLSRAVAMVLVGEAKRHSAARVLSATDFEPSWPATFIHRCPDPRILLDRAAAA